jgi:hypothetical protein
LKREGQAGRQVVYIYKRLHPRKKKSVREKKEKAAFY